MARELDKSLLNHHKEKHFTAGEIVRDIIIGVSDGLTVPFALAAGLPRQRFLRSFSPLVLSGRRHLHGPRREFYTSLKKAAEVAEILSEYGIQPHEYTPVVNALRKNPKSMARFYDENPGAGGDSNKQNEKLHCDHRKCRFELGLEKPDPKRALQSALTIAIAYIVGGLVPLFPYIFIPTAKKAVAASVVLTLMALLIFGYAKGHFTGNKPFRSALQTAFIGAVASAAAFGMAKSVQG
ncbi:Vacuolar iron transporter 1 [Sesamum angolense]|uniref:Vacuolar iron transporter n=1 Tax=Sesamum angolense TaxID=2727404 RepID=A0AAE1WUV4_9LAMI|nr:Vacuolar iron transporter 1 [Sesamum angolense]